MFESIQNYHKKMMIMGAIKGFRDEGHSDDAIIAKMMRSFDVTREYVLDLMKTETA